MLSRASITAAALCLYASAAQAAPPVKIAVFPFLLMDSSGEGASPGRAERLTEATRQLADALRKTGRYAPVDMTPYAAQIAALQSPEECGECWAKLAKQAGATAEVLPNVHKVSTLISLMTLWFADVTTMQYTARVQGQIRGDTPEAYTKGIDFLVGQELGHHDSSAAAAP